MKPTFRLLVLTVLRRLLARDMEEGDVALVRQLDAAIEQEQNEQKERTDER